MEMKHLHTFLILSQIKNFTKTAEQLGYVQSNITSHIQKLEDELGVKLFERIGKSITLTVEGEQLVPYAQKLIALSSEIQDMYSHNLISSRLIVGVSESIGIYKLPQIIKQFKKRYPQIDLHIEVLDSAQMIPKLNQHSIDIAMTLDYPILDTAMIIEFKRKEAIGIFATPDHQLCHLESVDASYFANMPFILTGQGCCYRGEFEQDLKRFSIFPHIVLETSSIQIIKENALSHLGLCLLPEFTVQNEILQQQLKRIAYSTDYPMYLQMFYHKDKWLSPTLKEFISVAKKLL